MKNFLLLSIIIFPMLGFAQNRPLNDFYRKYRRTHEVQNFRIPGWLVRFGGSIARMAVETEQERVALELLRGVGPVRVMIAENGSRIPQQDVEKLRLDLLGEDFEDLIMVRDGRSNVNFMIRDEGNWIKNLFLIVNEGDGGEMVFFSAETNIHYDELYDVLKVLFREELKPYFEVIDEKTISKPVL